MRVVRGDFIEQFRAANKRKRNINSSYKAGFEVNSRPRYAKSSVVAAGTTATATYTQPIYYSPLHTPQTWQIPSKRREVYMWCRFWYEMEPKVGASIDIYRDLSMKGVINVCENPHIKEYYDEFAKKIKLNYWLKMIAHEYFLLGDVFPFLELKCDKCNGSGIDINTQQPCDHKGGEFTSLTLLNPDYVEVEQTCFSSDGSATIYLIPDPQLQQIVWNQHPREQYERIPEETRRKIMSGERIMLNPWCVSHIKYASSGYTIYGSPMIKRLFTTLAYKDKMRVAQWVIAERLIVPIKIVKVGNDSRPASEEDLENVMEQLALTQNDPNLTLVTHHAFELEWYSASGKILPLGTEFEMCNQDIMDGLMMNKALLNGEGPAYASAAIGIEAMISRLESFRETVADWIENKIYRPLAYMQGFTKRAENGEERLFYPKVTFPDLNLRDDTQMKQMYIDLKRDGNISLRTLLEYLGIDYDQEIELMRAEQFLLPSLTGAGEEMGALGGISGAGLPMDLGGVPPMDIGMSGFGGEMGGTFGPGGEMGMVNVPMPGGGMSPDFGPASSQVGSSPMGAGIHEGEPPFVSPISMPGDIQWPGMSSGANARLNSLLKHSNHGNSNALLRLGKEVFSAKGPKGNARYRFTDIELKLYNAIKAYRIPYQFFAQFKINNNDRYIVDGAFPQLKIAIEADGALFHSSPEHIARDKKRDAELARMGWRVLRFKEDEIKNSLPKVMQTICYYINQRVQQLRNLQYSQNVAKNATYQQQNFPVRGN